MNEVDLFNTATKIETPLMLAGLVVLVLFALLRSRVNDRQAKMLFILALVAIVLGVGADLVRAKIQPPLRYWLDGRVYSPPTDQTAGVPKAMVLFEIRQRGIQTYCTDEHGYFKFEIPTAALGETAQLWAVADGYHSSDLKDLQLARSLNPQNIGLVPVSRAASGTEKAEDNSTDSSHSNSEGVDSSQSNTCLNGDWHERLTGRPDQPDSFQWHFSVSGSTLSISRQDGFVHGAFQQTRLGLKGDLIWGNGDAWHNVILTPSADCHTISTNQFWYYEH